MSIWAFRVGIALSLVGALLLTPLADLLPIDFWLHLKGLVSFGEAKDAQVFYRVVSGEESRMVEFILIGIGLGLVGVSMYLRKRRGK